MDFTQVDIHAFLRASIPQRFQDISPYDFESFMAMLFRADGYDVEETGYSGDFGADLILQNGDKRTVVQVKRYASSTLVGVSDVNQVIGACSYYDVANALVVTTSDFSTPAIALAKTADVVLWNWQRLERYISTVLMENQDYDTFFAGEVFQENVSDATDEALLSLKLLELNDDVLANKNEEVIALHAGLENISGRNLTLHLDLPFVVSRKTGRQVSAVQWKDNYFFHGMLINEATVECACYFLKSQIPEIKPGDRLLLRVHVHGQDHPLLIDQLLKNPGSNCYIVTYCYGRDTMQYHQMIHFRDEILSRSATGVAFINGYYRYSPRLIRFLESSKLAGICSRWVLRPILTQFIKILGKLRSKV